MPDAGTHRSHRVVDTFSVFSGELVNGRINLSKKELEGRRVKNFNGRFVLTAAGVACATGLAGPAGATDPDRTPTLYGTPGLIEMPSATC